MDIQNLQKNLIFKNKILYFETINSTNTYLKENHNTLDSNTLVIAKTQTLGRGKNNRTWFSPFGGIYFSLLLKQDNSKNDILPLISGLAIVKSLSKFNIDTYLKWPNDIILHKKKLGGILVESKISKNSKAYIIGIGLNISSLLPSFEIKDKFISLNETVDTIPHNDVLISDICNNIFTLLDDKISVDVIIEEYKKYCLILEKNVYLLKDNSDGIFVNVLDVNCDGSLKVLDLKLNEFFDIYSGEFFISGIYDQI